MSSAANEERNVSKVSPGREAAIRRMRTRNQATLTATKTTNPRTAYTQVGTSASSVERVVQNKGYSIRESGRRIAAGIACHFGFSVDRFFWRF